MQGMEKSVKETDWVQKMRGVTVLVVGDIMLDRFVYGRVERISPESPVPVLSIERENMMLGGAGNTLSNLVHLKCKGRIVSVIGDDDTGAQIRALAEKLGIDTAGLLTLEGRLSIMKTRFLSGHQQLLRTDYERIADVPEDMCALLQEKLPSLLEGVGAVILSDYGKGLLTKELVKAVIKASHEKNIPVLVDPKGVDYSLYAGADVVTPNKKELAEATQDGAVGTDAEVVETAGRLIAQSGIRAVVATRSKDGMSVIGEDKPFHVKSASDVEVFDVSGAGDTVIATIAACLGAGADLKQAAFIANVAGSIVVSKVGTAPIREEELRAALLEHDADMADVKERAYISRVRRASVLAWDEAREQVQRWQARGLKVGFTNGCFDILHLGHVSYLNEARDKCDRLVLGLNSDASVGILKGPERPVHGEVARAGVLAALGSVDMVVLFGAQQKGDDNTACDLIACLQPDIYFKGGDYTIDQIPEAPSVLAYGGVVEVMPVYQGHSTTSSVEKIKAA